MQNNIKIVRFKDGLDVVCMIEEAEDFQYKLTSPMMFELRSSKLVLQYWLPVEVMKGNSVIIPGEEILCLIEPNDEFAEFYEKSVLKADEYVDSKSNISKEENIQLMEALVELETIKGISIH
jgi:hypothetical protein